MYRLARTLVFSSLLALGGCAWFGVETLKPVQVEKERFYVSEVRATKDAAKKIEIGASINEVVNLLGNPTTSLIQNGVVLYKYPSFQKVRSGAVVCLGLIPLPARAEHDGEYSLYFVNDKLTKILRLETKGSFYGVYTDDSGSGAVSGEKSKCDI